MFRDTPPFLKTHSSSFMMQAPASTDHACFSEPAVKVRELRFIRATRVITDRVTGQEVIRECTDGQQPEKVGRCRFMDQLWVFKTENGKSFSLLLHSIEDAKEFAKYMGIGFDNFHPVREDEPIVRRPLQKENET